MILNLLLFLFLISPALSSAHIYFDDLSTPSSDTDENSTLPWSLSPPSSNRIFLDDLRILDVKIIDNHEPEPIPASKKFLPTISGPHIDYMFGVVNKTETRFHLRPEVIDRLIFANCILNGKVNEYNKKAEKEGLLLLPIPTIMLVEGYRTVEQQEQHFQSYLDYDLKNTLPDFQSEDLIHNFTSIRIAPVYSVSDKRPFRPGHCCGAFATVVLGTNRWFGTYAPRLLSIIGMSKKEDHTWITSYEPTKPNKRAMRELFVNSMQSAGLTNIAGIPYLWGFGDAYCAVVRGEATARYGIWTKEEIHAEAID